MKQRERRNKNKKNQIITVLSVLVLALSIFLFVFFKSDLSFLDREKMNNKVSQEEETTSSDKNTNKTVLDDPGFEKEEIQEVDRVKISMVGDNLLHMPTVKSGLQWDNTYNFDHFFENIKKYIEDSDIKIINQETILGGVEIGLSAYPQFNSPTEVADAINNAGFNVVTHANNHTMDKGYEGIKRTLENWDRFSNILVVGVNESSEDYNTINIVEVNNIKVAILSYTFSLNGISLPADMPWLVDMMYKEKISKDLEKAKEISDFILVLPHWGEEYVYKPNSYQTEMTNFLVDGGADLIIGSHPHVIQPVEWIERDDGKKTLVYYSLGNFISNQNRPPRMLGAMANVVLTRVKGDVVISEADILPLVTHYEWGRWDDSYTTYALSDYTDELAAIHGVARKEKDDRGDPIIKENFSIAWLEKMCNDILGDWYNKE